MKKQIYTTLGLAGFVSATILRMWRAEDTLFFQGFLTGLSIVLLIAGFIMKRKTGGKEETITGK